MNSRNYGDGLLCVLALALLFNAAARAVELPADLGKPKLVDEIDCSKVDKSRLFVEFPAGVSKVETILGTECRVLSNSEGDAKYFAYRVGEGKGLQAGKAYMLVVDYPEDRPRTIWVCNWGCETALGFATGQALGDCLKGKYVAFSPESLKYPLTGKYQSWSQLFYLHDRFPEIKRPRDPAVRPLTPADGFWVVFPQTPPFQDPLGAGVAVSKIRLYEMQDPAALTLKINFPPEGLPRRHIFSREEMADGVVAMGHQPAEKAENLRGVKEPADWFEYKMRVMAFLGVDTFAKDLLEFGHNQGWDSAEAGGDAWVNQSSTPELWAQILERARKLNVNVLPYYEYRGSIGQDKTISLGVQKRAKPLSGGEAFGNIDWLENTNADLLDPDTLSDFKKMVDLTVVKYKDKAKFIGLWLRLRPSALPISFNEQNLRLFSTEANDGTRISRSQLHADKALLEKYYTWWFGKRKVFLEAIRDYAREKVGKEMFVLYTNDTSEPGRPLPRSITGEGQKDAWQWMQVVANDDMDTWSKILADDKHYQWVKPYEINQIIDKDMHLRAQQTPAENWDPKLELDHSMPHDDPANYKESEGVLLSYTYNRLYTVGSPRTFAPYQNKSGLAIMRHYALNEHEMNVGNDEPLGYFIMDVERNGPYCMMAEARAMAYGDPTQLGSLTANSNKRGFPAYVRNFHAAFLALPALPSEVVAGASSDPEVVVRAIKTPGHGTYYSVVNVGFDEKKDVVITLPAAASFTDAATAQAITSDAGKLTMTLYPAQLRAIHAP